MPFCGPSPNISPCCGKISEAGTREGGEKSSLLIVLTFALYVSPLMIINMFVSETVLLQKREDKMACFIVILPHQIVCQPCDGKMMNGTTMGNDRLGFGANWTA